LQQSPTRIESAIAELNIAPALVLNGLEYFDISADESRVSDCLVEREVAAIRRRVGQPVKETSRA
jgi:hypothetical protein